MAGGGKHRKAARMAVSPTALNESPSHLLHKALQRALSLYAEEMGEVGLTQRQFALLAAAAETVEPSQSDLVATTGIDRSTLAELTARMIARGLIERERSVRDGRAKTVRLTEAGRATLEAARPRAAAADKHILALAPKSKRESFIKLLVLLGEDRPEASSDQGRGKAGKKDKKGRKAEKKKAAAEDVSDADVEVEA